MKEAKMRFTVFACNFIEHHA